MTPVTVGNVTIGGGAPVLIGGPCMAESLELCCEVAAYLKELTAERDRLADDVAGLEETVQKQNAELEAIKSTLETKTADLEEARKQLDEVNAAAAKLDAEYRDKLEEIKPLLDSFFKDCGLITHRSERIDKDLMLVRPAAESEDFRKNMKDLHGFLKRLDSVEKEMKQIMKEYNEVIIITEK